MTTNPSCLTELKTLNERIAKAIKEADYMAIDHQSQSTQKIKGLSIEDYLNKTKRDLRTNPKSLL